MNHEHINSAENCGPGFAIAAEPGPSVDWGLAAEAARDAQEAYDLRNRFALQRAHGKLTALLNALR